MKGHATQFGDRRSRGAILYDFLRVPGGAERVTLVLAQALRNITLCVGSASESAYWRDYIEPSDMVPLGVNANWAPWLAIRSLRAFQKDTTFLRNYDWVLYSGSYAPIAIENHPTGPNLYYCHTIPRFIYDLRKYYLENLPVLARPALLGLIEYVQPRFEAALRRMDFIIANSKTVQARLEHFLKMKSRVIYPPCNTEAFEWEAPQGYYLSTARLEAYKRVDLIIKAFLKMPDKKLVVASGGSEEKELMKIAQGASNIHFTGWCGDRRLQKIISRSIATIYLPKDEDFGLSPVESMAAGKPVIGVAEGGPTETVLQDRTGLLLPPEPQPEDLIEAVNQMTVKRAGEMRGECEAQAANFGKARFIDEMRGLLNRASIA